MDNRLLALARLDENFQRLAVLRWITRAVLLLSLVTALLFFSQENPMSVQLFGFFFIILPVGILLDIFWLFLRSEVGKEEARESKITNGITFRTARILAKARKRPMHLWHFLLRDESTRFVLLRLGLLPSQFDSGLDPSLEYSAWLQQAKALAAEQQKPLSPQHLFEAVQSQPNFVALWKELGISSDERKDVWEWFERVDAEQQKARRGIADTLRFSGGIGRDWASGYTHALEQFAFDLTDQIAHLNHDIELTGHQEERKKVLQYLNRDHQHNVLMIGDEGIGKQRMVYALASDFNRGVVPINLKYKHIYQLDVGQLISAQNNEELQARLQAVLSEAATVGNIVLVIPDFDLLVGRQKSDELGVINASAVLSHFLQSTAIQIIGIITPEAYYKYVKPNAALEPFVLPVEVKEITSSDALHILEDEVFRYEYKTGRMFTYLALLKIIQIAEQHIHDKPYPEKAIGLLDEVSGAASAGTSKFILAEDVERIVGEKLKLPIASASPEERETLSNLESVIKTRIIGQDEAVKVVADALRRARTGLHSGKRPIGSFLFLGPTGVGKTEMAKTIAAIYFQNEKAFIRADMSEYITPESIEKLVGTQSSPGMLTTAVTDQPFSVVLLDEIEKASQPVRNLFLQILDDGRVTDGYGKKVDFTNTMVIATSNAGSQMIHEAVNAGNLDANFKPRLLEWLQSQGIFSPEWLNRFDAIVVFLPLTQEEIRQVAHQQVAELVERVKSHDINLTIAEDVYDVLVERGYDPEFGARPMRRAVQDIIESALAKALLNDTNTGEKNITITKDMLQ